MRLLVVAVISALVSAREISTADKYDYVVSVPDIHGDLDVLLRSLWMARGEIEGAEAAGSFPAFKTLFSNAVAGAPAAVSPAPTKRVLVVQTGDIIDRGAESLSCYKAIWQVEKVMGWTLINLIGNHELMTIAGQADHYAHPNDIKEFGSLAARRAAFSPGGKVWKRITDDFFFMARVSFGDSENVLFVHAGMHPKWIKTLKTKTGDTSIGGMNKFLMDELKRNPNSDFLSSAVSPVWTREMAQDTDSVVCSNLLPQVLTALNVTRIVVGHTPQEALVSTARCDARIVLADVAMSRWMGSGKFGNPAALIFALADNGSKLERIYNVYWKGANEQVVDQLIYQPGEPAGSDAQEL